MSNKSPSIPLSFAQQHLWSLAHQLEPKKSTYNISVACRIRGLLDISILEKSINAVCKRHKILQTTFESVDGTPKQVVSSEINVTLPLINLQNLSRKQQDNEVRQYAGREFYEPFELTQKLLWRAKLLCLAPDENVLLFTVHQIIFDRESLNVFFREIATFYDAFSQNKPSPLPEPPKQYSEFTQWQHQRFQGEVLHSKLHFWKHQLNEQLPMLQLPTDHPRQSLNKYQKASLSLLLPQTLTAAFKTLSQRENVTLFMTLLTAFKILLYRYCQQEEIIIVSPDSSRWEFGTQDSIGLFTNSFALRTDLRGNLSFRELLEQVSKIVLKAHQELPLEKLVEELQIDKNQNFSPLHQVMFSFQENSVSVQEFSNLVLEPIPELVLESMGSSNVSANFDLALELRETPEGIKGCFEYNADLFDEATISRMAGHLQILMEGIVANPEQQISELPILTEPERHQILVEWNDTKVNYPLNKSIHQLFEEQVDRTPEAIAVVFEGQQLTYQQLNSQANQLARYLQRLGVQPETLVGICAKRSLEMVVGLLGILKAGGAYVPLDPDYPPERLAYMLEDSQVPVLLTQQDLLNQLPTHQAQVICLDKDWQKIASQQSENLRSSLTSDNLAYVIYTSGSTGKPKGAMNTHQGICNRLLWMQDTYKLDSSDRVLQKTPFSFDVSVWEFFLPLLAGACLVVAKPEGHKDSTYLVNLIIQQKITTLHFVPSMLQVFLEEQNLEHCNCLKRVICSGEALPWKLQERFFERLECELHNLYGPTEAAIDVTHWKCQRESSLRKVPIGLPIANTQLYILDSYLQPVPIGVPGELHIGGVQIARGYLNRPELTKQKFVPNPFQNMGSGTDASDANLLELKEKSQFNLHNSQRLYKTGDLVKYLPDGNIEYLRRLDYQVKIRGFRIELGEIENVISQHPMVRETIVIARRDRLEDQQLVAYIVFQQQVREENQETLSLTNLRHFLKDKLPDYMLPSAYLVLNAFPLTPNGKVNRHSLPAPDKLRPQLESTFVAPRNSVEEQIANIWSQILKIEQVGIYDNFFELGGYSLIAIRVIAQLRQAFEIELPLHIFTEVPTIAKLAEHIDKNRQKISA
ncbi:MAG: amino acid adenylation domain-containing protein [Calothrix sp. MO_167.B12]|nr:amino acid adenylation domain-containing protein [Calothrix sp. MO_167.B12]